MVISVSGQQVISAGNIARAMVCGLTQYEQVVIVAILTVYCIRKLKLF
jgi:hypothetical protein